MENRKIRPRDVVLGKAKRTVKCIQVYTKPFILTGLEIKKILWSPFGDQLGIFAGKKSKFAAKSADFAGKKSKFGEKSAGFAGF